MTRVDGRNACHGGPHGRPGRRLAAVIAAAVWTCIYGCGVDRVPDEAVTFVGRDACAGCHEEQAARWAGSHHDLAMQAARPNAVLGDFDGATFSKDDVTSTFFRRGDAFFVNTDGPDGALRDYEIAYTFGVDPLQQYLIEFPDGRIQVLGIAWDARPAAEGGQRWFHIYEDDPVPAGDVVHWTGPNQTWNFMCSECHSTNLRRNYDPETDAYRTTWSEINVSCEACHGPGAAHVEWAESEDRPSGDDAYPDPGLTIRLRDRGAGAWVRGPGEPIASRSAPRDADSQPDACGRCHARRETLTRAYEHGRPLSDTHNPRLLEPSIYFADGQIQDEVYVYGSFLQSRMHLAGVACSDCHDPHSLQLKAEGNALCGQCHAPEVYDAESHHHHEGGSAGAACVECHMPSRTYMVVDPRRDHSFRVPRPDLDVLGSPNACSACHTDRPAEWAAGTIDGWYGPERTAERRSQPHYGQILGAGRLRVPGGDASLSRLLLDRDESPIVRATAAQLLGDYGTGMAIESLRQTLSDPSPLIRTAAVLSLRALEPAERAPLVFHLLNDPVKSVRLAAVRVLAPTPTDALTTAQRVMLNAGFDEFMEAHRTNAERPESHMSLGVLELERGRLDAAEASYRTAMRLAPWFVPAYVNLADLYRGLGRDAEGEQILGAGLERLPEEPTLLHVLGLNLARQGRMEEALVAFARAAELAPDNPQLAYVYGAALHTAGDSEAAVQVLESLLERFPYDRNALFGLATIERSRGRIGRARGWADRIAAIWPDDPTVRQLIAELEAEGGP